MTDEELRRQIAHALIGTIQQEVDKIQFVAGLKLGLLTDLAESKKPIEADDEFGLKLVDDINRIKQQMDHQTAMLNDMKGLISNAWLR